MLYHQAFALVRLTIISTLHYRTVIAVGITKSIIANQIETKMPTREPLLDADAPSRAMLPASYSLKADDLDAEEFQAVDDELQRRGKELSQALDE